MPDITMCVNSSCEFRGKCYRYLAIPKEHWQSSHKYSHLENDCLWSAEGRKDVRTLEDIENEQSKRNNR